MGWRFAVAWFHDSLFWSSYFCKATVYFLHFSGHPSNSLSQSAKAELWFLGNRPSVSLSVVHSSQCHTQTPGTVCKTPLQLRKLVQSGRQSYLLIWRSTQTRERFFSHSDKLFLKTGVVHISSVTWGECQFFKLIITIWRSSST